MTVARFSAQPADTGLYRREHEHDACGVAMVATMRGTAGHDIVVHALDALRNLDHRGATGADPLVGDGAGILTQVPDAFFRAVLDAELPPAGAYAVGMAYLPDDADERAAAESRIEDIAASEGLDRRHGGGPRGLVGRQEGDAGGVGAAGREGEVDDLAQERVGDLREDARPVTHRRVGAGGTPVLQVAQGREGVVDDVVPRAAAHGGDERDTAGVVLVL